MDLWGPNGMREPEGFRIPDDINIEDVNFQSIYDDVLANETRTRYNLKGQLITLQPKDQEVDEYYKNRYSGSTKGEKTQAWALYHRELRDIFLPGSMRWETVIVACHLDEWRARPDRHPSGKVEVLQQPFPVALAIFVSNKDPYANFSAYFWQTQYRVLTLVMKYIEDKTGQLREHNEYLWEEELYLLHSFLEGMEGYSWEWRTRYIKEWKKGIPLVHQELEDNALRTYLQIKKRTYYKLQGIVNGELMRNYMFISPKTKELVKFASRFFGWTDLLPGLHIKYHVAATYREPSKLGTQLARIQAWDQEIAKWEDQRILKIQAKLRELKISDEQKDEAKEGSKKEVDKRLEVAMEGDEEAQEAEGSEDAKDVEHTKDARDVKGTRDVENTVMESNFDTNSNSDSDWAEENTPWTYFPTLDKSVDLVEVMRQFQHLVAEYSRHN